MQWHLGREALLHDRLKTARLQECGWLTLPITVDDVRHGPVDLSDRIKSQLASRRKSTRTPGVSGAFTSARAT